MTMDADVGISPQEMNTLFDDDDEGKSPDGGSPVVFPNKPMLEHKAFLCTLHSFFVVSSG